MHHSLECLPAKTEVIIEIGPAIATIGPRKSPALRVDEPPRVEVADAIVSAQASITPKSGDQSNFWQNPLTAIAYPLSTPTCSRNKKISFHIYSKINNFDFS